MISISVEPPRRANSKQCHFVVTTLLHIVRLSASMIHSARRMPFSLVHTIRYGLACQAFARQHFNALPLACTRITSIFNRDGNGGGAFCQDVWYSDTLLCSTLTSNMRTSRMRDHQLSLPWQQAFYSLWLKSLNLSIVVPSIHNFQNLCIVPYEPPILEWYYYLNAWLLY